MTRATEPALRVLHAVRVLGYAGTDRVAARAAVTAGAALEHLLDAEASGSVVRSTWGDEDGWSLTERGRAHGERLLAAELDAAGARPAVEDVHRDFLPLNDAVAAACTAWQLADLEFGAGGAATPATTTRALEGPATALVDLETRLTAHLDRFAGYAARFGDALARARTDPTWITATDRDSCHRVWFELHEDLIATLGLSR